jgi:hypothetical protein
MVNGGKKIKLTPEERAALCAKAQKERDEYENKHLGGFERIYPLASSIVEGEEQKKEGVSNVVDSSTIASSSSGTTNSCLNSGDECYEDYIRYAHQLWEEWTGASKKVLNSFLRN